MGATTLRLVDRLTGHRTGMGLTTTKNESKASKGRKLLEIKRHFWRQGLTRQDITIDTER